MPGKLKRRHIHPTVAKAGGRKIRRCQGLAVDLLRLRRLHLGYSRALSSGPQLHRLSFSTDLQEKELIFGGEPKLYRALTELIDAYSPKAAFVYPIVA